MMGLAQQRSLQQRRGNCSPSSIGAPRCRRRLQRTSLSIRAEAQILDSETPYTSAKEEARRQRRTLFTFDDWRRHRSGERYVHHFKTTISSGIVRAIVWPCIVSTLLALMVASYHAAFTAKPAWLPTWLPPPPSIAIEPIQLTTLALSLLLVFRTNASYARWEEARRMFGSITTTARDIARQAFSWFERENITAKAALARWLVALGRATMVHVRDAREHDIRQELQHVLPRAELEWLAASTHRPYFCLQVLTKIIANARLPQELLLRIDENISKLVSGISACERILNTPIPLSYTRHTARFLQLWLFCVPFTLWPYCGWAMVPLTALISFVLLGIDEIGVYIEEPFSLLALERLCDRLEVGISSMLREHLEIEEYLSHLDKTPLGEGTPDSITAAVAAATAATSAHRQATQAAAAAATGGSAGSGDGGHQPQTQSQQQQQQQEAHALAEQEQVLMQMFPATASAAAELQRATERVAQQAPELQYAQAAQQGATSSSDGFGQNGQHAPAS